MESMKIETCHMAEHYRETGTSRTDRQTDGQNCYINIARQRQFSRYRYIWR